jgi:hypothetical protein
LIDAKIPARALAFTPLPFPIPAVGCSEKGSQMPSGFWAGGRSAYYDGLKQQYDSQIASLRDQLRDCADDAQRAEIGSRIEVTEKEFKDRVRGIERLIF